MPMPRTPGVSHRVPLAAVGSASVTSGTSATVWRGGSGQCDPVECDWAQRALADLESLRRRRSGPGSVDSDKREHYRASLAVLEHRLGHHSLV